MGKRLQLDYIHIKEVKFAEKSEIVKGILYVNKEELLSIIRSDIFEEVDIKLAAPGENVRILGIHDVMQPRCKADNPETSYPGIWGKLAPMGDGKTIALKGVVVSDLYYKPAAAKFYMDMGGPCAKYSQFSKQYHVILDAKPVKEISNFAYAEALKHASLSINVYLAKLGIGMMPDETEIFEMAPLKSIPGEQALPRVAYLVTHLASFDTVDFLVYGESALGMLPTILQPTEILDGAMVWRYWENNYALQNEIYIRELLNRHGKDIEFAGVVITNNVMKSNEKEAMAMMGATLCKETLKADCVIVNKCGMGHSQLDAAFCFNWAEKLGMPAVMNLAAVSNDTPGDMLVISDPKIDAVINSGRNYTLEHPKMERIIGEEIAIPSLKGLDARGPFTHTTNYALMGIWSQLGDFYETADSDIDFVKSGAGAT